MSPVSSPPVATAETIRKLLLIFLRRRVYEKHHESQRRLRATRRGRRDTGWRQLAGHGRRSRSSPPRRSSRRCSGERSTRRSSRWRSRSWSAFMQLMADQSPQARQEVALTNVPVVVAQAERFRSRLGFWEIGLPAHRWPRRCCSGGCARPSRIARHNTSLLLKLLRSPRHTDFTWDRRRNGFQ